ncbi:MAG: hypothetical protein ACM34K_07960, partial [Bacillota bacterium]
TTGSKLFSGDKVKLEDNSYLGLCYVKGRTLEVTTPGEFNVDDLAKNLTAENSSVTKRMTSYIINEMIIKNKTKEMKNMAGVVRQNLAYIDKDFPNSTIVIDTLVTFRWFPAKEAKSYAFEIRNPSSKAVFLKETEDTSVTVNVLDLELEPGKCYYWFVYDPENQSVASDSNCIMVMNKAAYQSITDSVRQLRSDLSDPRSPLNQIIIASFYENNNMYLNALSYYQNAMKYLGTVEEFQKKYILFLMKAGLFRRAQITLENWNLY